MCLWELIEIRMMAVRARAREEIRETRRRRGHTESLVFFSDEVESFGGFRAVGEVADSEGYVAVRRPGITFVMGEWWELFPRKKG